jgi:hypothetical protein
VIERALAPRSSRYPTVADFSHALSRTKLSTGPERWTPRHLAWLAAAVALLGAGLWFGRDRVRALALGRPEEVAERPAESVADPASAMPSGATSRAAIAKVPGPAPVGPPGSRGRVADSTHRSGPPTPAQPAAGGGGALSPFRRSHPWAAHPGGREYFRSSCPLALGSSDLLYFESESEASGTGRVRSTAPGCS